jgi:hypothetical protein
MENNYLKKKSDDYFKEEKKFANLFGLIEKNLNNLKFKEAQLLILQAQAEKLICMEEHLKNSN